LLKREEIKAIKAKGEEFNPFYHEAVGEAVSKKSDKNKVIRVIQKGYMMGERVIRPSKVYVGK
jgi:molecular chaperone GrpE